MNEFRLVINGNSVPKGRGRIVRFGNRPGIMTPPNTRRYEDLVRQTALQAWSGRKLLADVPVEMHLTFYRSVPVSWPKRRQQAALLGVVRPTAKPDLDNLIKSCVDGMNGVVYLDDGLICDYHCSKRYAAEPRVEIVLRWPEADAPAVAIPSELSLVPPEPPLATRPRTPPPPDIDSKPF